ncbi:reverse transcriptase domain-containing protein [Tanacetum coccineum]
MTFRVATLRAVVHTGDKTRGDASVGWPAAASRGGGTGGRAGRGGGRTRSQSAQVGDQGRGQGNGRKQNGDAINDNIQGDVRNVIENNDYRGCTYKEFLACNPKEYDGKGVKYTAGSFVGKALTWWNFQICTLGREVVACMSWDNFKLLMREDFCPSNEMQKLETKLWNHTMVEAGHAAYTDRFHELARLVPQLVTSENRRIKRYVYGLVLQIRGMVVAMEPSTIQKAVQIAGTLTDEALRNRSIKKNLEKRGNRGEPSKNRNGKDDTGNDFATTTNPVRRECTGTAPMVPRNMNPINARNPTARACYECGSTAYVKAACPRLNQAIKGKGSHSKTKFVVVNRVRESETQRFRVCYEIEISIQATSRNRLRALRDCKLENRRDFTAVKYRIFSNTFAFDSSNSAAFSFIGKRIKADSTIRVN